MEPTKLLEDIKRANRSAAKGRYKGKNETKSDFIKKRNRFKCFYCHGNFRTNPKKLKTSVERFHEVKPGDTLERIANFYQTEVDILRELNEQVNCDKLSYGDFLKLDTDFKVFPNTHGICFCTKCAVEKQKLKMGHVDYWNYVLRKRKNSRNLVDGVLREKIFRRDNYECIYCVKEYGFTNKDVQLTVDHKKPIVAGGTSDEENLCACCSDHNQDKGELSYDEYLKKIKERKFLKENSVFA